MNKIRSFDCLSSWRYKDIVPQILNYLIPILTGIYIFINPLPLDSISEVCYYFSCAALITLLLFRKTTFTLRSPLSIGLGLFFFWAVLGLFTTLDFSHTLHDLRGNLLEYLVIFYLLVNFYNSRNRLEFLSDLIIASAMVFSVVGLIVFYGIEGNPLSTRFGQTSGKMFTGFMCFTTIFAAILSLRGLYQPGSILRQAVYFFCFLVLTVATMLNQSRAVIISLSAALLITCLHRKKNIILIAVAAIIIVFTPGFIDRINAIGFTQDIRSKMFRLSWEVIKDYPVYGVGYGGQIYSNPKLIDLEKYNASLPEKYQQNKFIWQIYSKPKLIDLEKYDASLLEKYQHKKFIITSTHNTFLDVAIRTGLVGLTLFCLIVLTALWMLWDIFFRRRSDEFFRSWSIYLFACLVSIMILSFFLDALYGAQGIILYIILAMINILWNLARKDRAIPSGVKT